MYNLLYRKNGCMDKNAINKDTLFTLLIVVIALMFGVWTFLLVGKNMDLTLTSSSFKPGSSIPRNFTCDGENFSPHLRWNAFNNANLKSYVLIVDDPDAQQVVGHTFVHWIVLLPPTSTELSQGISFNGGSKLLIDHPNAKELQNDFGKRNYGGPCPPHGTHTYRFTLFATSESIDAMDTEFFKEPFSADAFSKYMGSKIIAESSIVGTYARTR
jgi:Raf kinase inhibitor-like YbhB/YbcL family protein